MTSFGRGTVAERTGRLLTTTSRPLTAAAIAEQIGTSPRQARRALCRLEDQGTAFRQIAAGGRYEWTVRRP